MTLNLRKKKRFGHLKVKVELPCVFSVHGFGFCTCVWYGVWTLVVAEITNIPCACFSVVNECLDDIGV